MRIHSVINPYDVIVVGFGIAGAIIARELAERAGRKVVMLEARDHIGGNAYDLKNTDGILVHRYGPHIFHTEHQRVFDYLSRFTQWRDYSHEVVGHIHEGQTQDPPLIFMLISCRNYSLEPGL